MGDRAYVSLLVRKEDQEKVRQILFNNSLIVEDDVGFEIEGDAQHKVLVEFSIGEVNYADNASEYDFIFSEKVPCIIHYGSGNTYGSGTYKGDFKGDQYVIEHIESSSFLSLNVADVIAMVEGMESKEQLLADLKKFEADQNSILVLSSTQPSP